MSELLRVALIGGGKMALQHAAAIQRCGNARLVAVVDPFVPASELVSKFGSEIAPYSDIPEMLADFKPDVVHVVTPPGTHAELARACLEFGAHVYVEKPFALTTAEAESVLRLAESKGLRVCAAHQLLFQDVGRDYRQELALIGEIVHAESFFTFRPVRRLAGGGISSAVEQLIDILPHPVYVLLNALTVVGGGRAEITALDVSIDGEVRAVIRHDKALSTLVVSLNARPVESWLRVMGRNGMVEIDFVLGNVIRHPGPGASAPAVVLKPFSRAWQTGWGSLKALTRIAFRRQKSYPGLGELLSQFYKSIQEQTASPIGAEEITETVRICEVISARLRGDEQASDEHAALQLRAMESKMPALNDRGVVLLTGGTGLLGRPTARLLRDAGWRVRVPVRRKLSPRRQLPGVEYALQDLAESIPASLLAGVETVVHLAAETAGQVADHERNTIRVMRNLLEAIVRVGGRRLVLIGSLAVLRPSRSGKPLSEDSPVDYDNLERGPYVWAKAESERLAMQAARAGKIEVRTIRLGPLVDYEFFAAPGRLGREVARLFVAVGQPGSKISICSVSSAAKVIRYYVEKFEFAPAIANLVETPIPTRRALVTRLQHGRADLRVLWLPFWMLRILSIAYTLVQKIIIRPKSSPLNLYSAFAPESYDFRIAESLIAAATRSDTTLQDTSGGATGDSPKN